MSGVTRDLWPSDIKSEEVLSPLDIMTYQAELLASRTGNLLSAEVIRSESADRVKLAFEVHAPRIDRRMQLFTVQHRKEFDYPAVVDAPKHKLPDYLKERYYQPGQSELIQNVAGINKALDSVFTAKGRWVENDLRATSPTEFLDILSIVLADATVKASILSLISRSNQVTKSSPMENSESNCTEVEGSTES